MKWLRPIFVILFLAILVLGGCARSRPEEGPAAQPTTAPGQPASALDDSSKVLVSAPTTSYVPGQMLVKFSKAATPKLPTERTEKQEGIQSLSIGSESLDPIFAAAGITGLEPLLSPVAKATGQQFESLRAQAGEAGQFYLASFDPNKDIETVTSNLSASDLVEYAEPNFVAYATGAPVLAPHQAIPNDPFFQYPWDMEAIQMPQAWDMSTGQGVTVAVLDTGIAYENYQTFKQASDLAGTTFVNGYDFINGDTHPNDDNGHGTHVAGTLAQTTNNGEGVAGVAYNASIMPVKVLDSLGQGTYAGIIQGIDFAVANGAKVINLSLSGHSGSQALEEAVNQARAQDVLVVAAVGNNNGLVEYPARYDSVLAVGAVRFDKSRARYSNVGPQVDVVAPGGDNQIDQNNDGFGDGIVQQTFKPGEINTFRYLFMEGTSMATPHVSGLAALLLSKDPSLSPDELENVMKSSALDLGPSGVDEEYGAGLIQAASALAIIGGGPVPPTATPTTAPGETPTPTPVTPPTATPTPGVPTPPPVTGDIIQNGGFEHDSAWLFMDTPVDGRYSTAKAHSGNRSALVGITDPAQDQFAYSSVAQKVTIPANATKATLSAWVYPLSGDIPSGDVQVTMILDANFRVVRQLSTMLKNDQTWQEQSFDVTDFRGQMIYVYFGAVNVRVNGKVTAMYVDDVSLIVEQ